MAPAPFGTTPPTTHHPTPGVTTIAHYSEASQTGSPFNDKLVAALDIPLELTDHTDKNLVFAWQVYKACEAAIKTCDSLWQSGKLKEVFDKTPRSPSTQKWYLGWRIPVTNYLIWSYGVYSSHP